MLYIVSSSEYALVPTYYVVLAIIFMVLPAIALYVLRSIGLYKLAKNNNVKGKAFAWIPFLWIYTACKLCGSVRFFGKTHKSLPVIFTVLYTIAGILPILYDVLAYFPIVGYYLQGGTISFGNPLTESSQLYMTVLENVGIYVETTGHFAFYNPYPNPRAMIQALDVLYYVVSILELAVIFIEVPVYFDLFRKYIPQRALLFGLLSVFLNIFPIMVFIIRNKKAVDYNEYMRQRYNTYYGGMNNQNYNGQNGGNYYGGGYYGGYNGGANNGQNGYGANAGGNGQPNGNSKGKKPEDDDPFPEFKDK
ncbi:MAG: hypothetical protein IJZ73_00680 [Clostridia bacterium]|nr:hypothetical protein [Clostridia bacterium]